MGWETLQCGVPGSPNLLVKARFDSAGYCIELTDLSRIWSETLSKDEIIRRATDLNSSIDPSEDEEQFNIFLGKVQSALNGEDGASHQLSSGEASDLQFHLSAPLPKPLPPFRWTLQLRRQSEQQIGSELLTPLILQTSNLQRKIQQLIDHLHDKDRVISKICDRLETSGNDLTTVFPGVSNLRTSRKKGQREQLAKHVKGLDDFDESLWRKHNDGADGQEELNASIIGDAFKDLPPSMRHSNDGLGSEWWKHLSKASTAGAASQAHLTRGALGGNVDQEQRITANDGEDGEDSMQIDEFQRQETPPQLRHPSNVQIDPQNTGKVLDDMDVSESVDRADGDSTTDDEDEDDLDAPSRKQPRAQPRHTEGTKDRYSASPRKTGMIGGRLQPSSQATSSREQTAAAPHESPKPKTKLGAMGGKQKAATAAPTPILQQNDDVVRESTPAKSSKLGTIGGRRPANTPEPEPALSSAVRTPEASGEIAFPQSRLPEKKTVTPPLETTEEMADKKRDRLKRELEEKAKAPIKKKRKF